MLDPTWQLNTTQFCHNHYMNYIINRTIGPSIIKRQWESDDNPIMRFDSDDSEPKLVEEIDLPSKASEVRDNKGVSEFDFIESVRSMAQIFYAREKKEKILPIYDWKLLQEDMESKDSRLRPFFNMLEKLINPSSRGLVDQTIVQ